ncbi:hypothetical protein [Wolbachia endosymbiont (group A) of Anomoia purmunda]|uniref:hypothetical protein n=1 Tax=Wolbachia endosymbiont (group A) of Anomoia purmunda TaxID=2953978 RepID=UPI002230D468|nr:hypothetical protein [Wolbachia endosymbiont (group A) of Anomoia purmunda]
MKSHKPASIAKTSYRDSFHNCTNIAILAYQKGVMKVADTGSFMTVSSQCPDTGIQET